MSDTPADKTTESPEKSNSDIWGISPDVWKRVVRYLQPPLAHRWVTWEGVTEDIQGEIRDAIKDLQLNRKGFLLTGDVGTGKSSILRLTQTIHCGRVLEALGDGSLDHIEDETERIMAEAHQRENPLVAQACSRVLFINHFHLVRILRRYIDDVDVGFPPTGLQYPIILLDDLGRGYEDPAGWNMTLLDEFFDYRWAERLPLCVSTNKTTEQLREWPGWSRIVDRLADPEYMTAISTGTESRRR